MGKRVVVLAALVVAGWVPSSEAIPAFARRYGVACHFCHEGYPKLNHQGQRFKERGFRMEREEAFELARWLTSAPITVRAHLNRFLNEDAEDTTTSLIKGVSAGNLGSRVSYWVDDAALWLKAPSGAGDDFDNFRHVEPDNAWVRIDVIEKGRLYVRGGRFELDLPFTQTRTPHLLPYDIYFTSTGFETDNIGGYHHGFELGGALPGDARWSAAIVDGRNPKGADELNADAGKFDGNLYLRLSKRLSRNRVGVFAYIGRNTIVLGPTNLFDDNLLRLGGDASVWLDKLNLYGVFMYGRNDNAVNSIARPEGTMQAQSFSGGFAQADYHARDNLVLNLRASLVSQPISLSGSDRHTLTALVPGAQLYLLWDHLKLSFEYALLNKDRSGFGAIQAEVAF